ncbi:MAG: Rrf2 family transcriptional regulator [Candidatus Binatia bacterium]
MHKPTPASGAVRVRPQEAEVPAGVCSQSGEGHKGARSSIMNVGKRVDYAIRALCYLAAQPPERIVRGAEIQERQNIPPHFLSKILRSLVGAELLASVPGPHGGFRLGRPARDISVRAVYESIQGQLSLIDCVDQREAFCSFAPVCTQLQIWSGAQQVLTQYLERISIGDIADGNGLVRRLREAAPGRLQRTRRPGRAI